ncbi:MAG: hypothetical protein KR126chlam1_01142 [Chlamydiae bacterium]|nr:hypothetical protein [Chlamydiota bacterium]
MPTAGLIVGPEYHHLDHLAPLCSLLDLPLLVTDQEMASIAKKYYPDLSLCHFVEEEIPERVIQEFDTILYSTPRVLFDELFFFAEAFHQKKIRTVWCPHGNSDKGRGTTAFMEGLKEEETLLTYGPRIEVFLREKGIEGTFLRVGNYRLNYFEKHRKFYNHLMKDILPEKAKHTLLYAPTWQDGEKNSSFTDLWEKGFSEIPSDYTLLVKLHPNLYRQYPDQIAEMQSKAPKQVHFLENLPPIYPLLSHIDLFIGDAASSIGYDFLYFKKPMLLFSNENDPPLAKAGKVIPPMQFSFSQCEKLLHSSPPKNSLYEETFAPFNLTKLQKLLNVNPIYS